VYEAAKRSAPVSGIPFQKESSSVDLFAGGSVLQNALLRKTYQALRVNMVSRLDADMSK